jgi:hypothetical protein
MGPYAGTDYNLTLCPLQSDRVDSNTFTMATLCQCRPKPYAIVDFTPQSGTLDLASAVSKHVVNS